MEGGVSYITFPLLVKGEKVESDLSVLENDVEFKTLLVFLS